MMLLLLIVVEKRGRVAGRRGGRRRGRREVVVGKSAERRGSEFLEARRGAERVSEPRVVVIGSR